ncbi:S9 family peptidase [Halovenus salina]|uniref:S9 family peptidase n=1 Tax=Halovenus salina TaxID=1510225 RepID=UPI002260EE63|nr:S9 family peptidase [Halovenus salina]
MIDADALYDITQIGDAAVSPDGERVAFLTKEYDPTEEEAVNSLWVAPTDGTREPHRLTRASDGSSPKWSPDGSMLAFLTTRERDPDLRVGRDDEDDEDDDGDDDSDNEDDEDAESDAGGPKPQVWAFDMELGGDATQLTDHDEGVSSFDWGPDGDRLVVAARDPTDEQQEYLDQREDGGPIEVERLQHKYDGQGYLDEVTTYLFVVDVATQEIERIDEANDGGYGFAGGLDPAWGPDDRIAYTASHTDWPDDSYVRDIYTIDPDGGNRRKVTTSDHAAASPVWSPDGDRLAFTASDPENWYTPTELFVADREEFWSVTDGLDRTLGRGAPAWVDSETLLSLVGDKGRTRFVRCDAKGGAERVYERQGDLETVGTMDVGGDTVVFAASAPTEGTDLFALDAGDIDASDAERTRLTAVNDDFLDEHPVPECTRLSFEGARGDEVEGLVYYPDDFDPENPDERGVILSIHGGPMTYDEPGFRFQNALFTSRGYLVCRVNYHGSTSYGRDFCESLKGEWGTHEVADLLAGVDELLDRGWADPDRLFPTGFSQGGVNTGYLVTQDDRWAAAAAEHGIYDLRSSFGTDDSQNWLEADFGLPWENPDAYEAASAITDVGNVETPLLVTAGENDHRCPPSQSEQLYVSVRKQGVDAKLVIYPDEHHNVGDPDRAIHRLETLDAWFAEYDPERENEA